MFKIKINSLDKLVTKVVRLREKEICQKCGAKVHGQNSHAAHIMPRRHKVTRWYSPNILHLCFKCHRWGHSEVTAFNEWVKEIIGENEFSKLQLMARETWDKDTFAIKIYLQEELKKYENRR